MNTQDFQWIAYYLAECLNLFQNTVIFNAYGYTVTLWDLYTVSTILIAFFDAVIFPVMAAFGLAYDDESTGIIDDVENENSDHETGV